jgi:histone H4
MEITPQFFRKRLQEALRRPDATVRSVYTRINPSVQLKRIISALNANHLDTPISQMKWDPKDLEGRLTPAGEEAELALTSKVHNFVMSHNPPKGWYDTRLLFGGPTDPTGPTGYSQPSKSIVGFTPLISSETDSILIPPSPPSTSYGSIRPLLTSTPMSSPKVQRSLSMVPLTAQTRTQTPKPSTSYGSIRPVLTSTPMPSPKVQRSLSMAPLTAQTRTQTPKPIRRTIRNRPPLVKLSKGDVRRLARRGGVKRMSMDCKDECEITLREYLRDVIEAAVNYTVYSNRKTVSLSDVAMALKFKGQTLYM